MIIHVYLCSISTHSINYLLFTVSLPTIISQPRSIVVDVYNVAIFECTARSYGYVSITWRRLNFELPVTANVVTNKSSNEITSILRIEKSVGHHKGSYYCVVENKAGRVNSALAYFNITGKPLYICTYLCIYIKTK